LGRHFLDEEPVRYWAEFFRPMPQHGDAELGAEIFVTFREDSSNHT